MRFSKPTLMGGILGFVMGVLFLVISLFQFDQSETNARDVALVSLLFGIPFSVLIGLGIGWLWGKLFGVDSAYECERCGDRIAEPSGYCDKCAST